MVEKVIISLFLPEQKRERERETCGYDCAMQTDKKKASEEGKENHLTATLHYF
jgi:hypothetical protein